MTTAYGDPNSDVAYTWVDNAATDYTRINDAVRDPGNPSSGGDGESCNADGNDDSEIATFGCSEPSISGTVTQVVVKAYCGATSVPFTMGAYYNGSDQATGSFTAVTPSAWFTKSYSGLSIDAASLFPWKINITPGTIDKSDQLVVHGAYLEVTYTAAAADSGNAQAFTDNVSAISVINCPTVVEAY